MAITSSLCASFMEELLKGVHDFDTDVIKLALIKTSPSGTFGEGTTNYSNLSTDEASDTSGNAGYTAGGVTLASVVVGVTGGVAYVNWGTDASWGPEVSIAARGALIYNSSKSNKAIAVFDFGADKVSTTGPYTLEMPASDSTHALIRLSDS